MAQISALILAGGTGSRVGNEIPKQYLKLDDRPVLVHAIQAFLDHPLTSHVQVVIAKEHRHLYMDATRGLSVPPPVIGGVTRQDSVLSGLESLAMEPPDIVLIHDAARPFVDKATIDRVLGALRSAPAAIAGLAVTDTIQRGTGSPAFVTETIDRQGLWAAQTPQGFRYAEIIAAHRAAIGLDMTDDATVARAHEMRVSIVEGNVNNLKITTPLDLSRARKIVRSMKSEIRVGSGFDVHAFGDGDHVMLCGCRILHEQGLRGHSDSDVAIHALTDALLGAIGAGDIGTHFPPSDDRWRNAPSRIFLDSARTLISEKGGSITNIDVTIICETPRIAPHRDAMRASLAEILSLDPDRISVKATTTEKLGFIGRQEGVAVQATATVCLR